jgi:hypothetical protein
MKNLLFGLFVSFLVTVSISAQNTAGIYKITFNIDQDLVNEVRVRVAGETTTPDRFTLSRTFPNHLIDSIKTVITNVVSKQIGADAKIVYKKNRRGQDITSFGTASQLQGMPRNLLKKAVLADEKDYYVKVRVNYSARGGASMPVFGTSVSQVRPVVTIRIKAYDVERKKMYDKKVRVRDFTRLRAIENTIGNVTVRRSQVLSPNDIYLMLIRTIEEFEK